MVQKQIKDPKRERGRGMKQGIEILKRFTELVRQKGHEFEVTKKPEDRVKPCLFSLANELEAFTAGLEMGLLSKLEESNDAPRR